MIVKRPSNKVKHILKMYRCAEYNRRIYLVTSNFMMNKIEQIKTLMPKVGDQVIQFRRYSKEEL